MTSSANNDKTPLHGSSGSDDSDSHDSFLGSLLGGFFCGLFGGHSIDHNDWGSGSGSGSGSDTTPSLAMPIDASYLFPLNGPIASVARFSISPMLAGKRDALGVYVAGGFADLQNGSLADRGANNLDMIELGLTYRHYFTRPQTFFSPYVTASMGLQGWQWNYRNSLLVDGETVDGDGLAAFTGNVGLGLAIRPNHRCSLFTEVDFGGVAFAGETGQGFHNDVFDNFGYVSVKAGLTFKF
jgi:hypothetical protein